MTKNNTIMALMMGLISLSCTSFKILTKESDTILAKDIRPIGRYILDENKNIELISSAVHFGFTFKGTECKIFASLNDKSGHNYLQYEMDGEYQKRIKVSGNSTQPIIITAPKDGMHTVWIYKATEAHTGPILIQKISAKDVRSVKESNAPFIEFIGNSITCGALADASEVPCGTGVYHDQHNAYMAYGPRVARALGVNFVLSSVSGIGIYRNWNSTSPTMPEVYEKTDLQEISNSSWNFNLFSPKVVSIALGTNDLSNGDGIKKRLPFDSNVFVSSYVKFVQLVQTKYPQAQIVLLSSPMANGTSRILLQNCLLAVKEKIDTRNKSGKKVAFYFFEPMHASGCGGHPSVEDHAILAKELIPFFKKFL